ncbi:DUF805 domain-containing protein [Aliiroseovarius crassostreae]|uniref:DUF805 domain-containing protein n=1 Tax=Aliiroseovarius crassostreae TaxID=154981 RepID=UPI003C7EA9E0
MTFHGRAIRSEYWWFSLFLIVVSLVLTGVDAMVFGYGEIFSPLSDLFGLATLLPAIAVTARRLHDIDRSGWWMLIGIIPLIGWIIMIYWLVQKGTEGPNRFGPDPFGDAPQGGEYTDDAYSPSSIPDTRG